MCSLVRILLMETKERITKQLATKNVVDGTPNGMSSASLAPLPAINIQS